MWGRLTDIVTDRHTEKQTDRQIDRHITYQLAPYVLAKPYLASLFHDPVRREGREGRVEGRRRGCMQDKREMRKYHEL